MLAFGWVVSLRPADLAHLDVHPSRGAIRGHVLVLSVVHHGCEPGRERGPALVQPGLDGPAGDAELGRHLEVTEPLQVKQQHGVPLASRQLVDGGPHTAGQVGDLGGLGRTGQRRRLVGEHRGKLGAELTAPAPRHVQCDAAEPCAEARGGLEPVQVRHGGHRSLLRGVAGEVGRAEDPPGQEGGRLPVPQQQLSQRLTISEQGSTHKLGIRPTASRPSHDS